MPHACKGRKSVIIHIVCMHKYIAIYSIYQYIAICTSLTKPAPGGYIYMIMYYHGSDCGLKKHRGYAVLW